ncbi:indolepyruvate ferredoxin oxidoreductase beta subunit [Ruminococcus flavefaciens]|uniref:Indolepyruvate ferredoxin oxidoreductase beta subunit n=1 Tax=Ruminococcus flavefaciens TaxID=1265 RepID=A0A1H6KL68_RUMFL|nr:indolepyruvate oxidoreductase subunit beta [Ruminococcus flavefaciens]SEH72585.1 indolepyruvate ferredoxin oxidoreductase beta subunit [Ruminococcus flavefaciens]
MNKNILLCGVGGQGIVLTSKLTASCAMEKGMQIMSAETIGMAQKGGSVFSFLRIGEGIYCPMFGQKQADIMIAFEPAEAVRMLPYLRDGGTVIVNTHPIMPVTASLKASDYNGTEMLDYLRKYTDNVMAVDGDNVCRELGSPKVLNMVMLGEAIRSGILPFTIDDAVEAMKRNVKPQFVELNEKALRHNV